MDYPDELSQRMARAACERLRQIQDDLDKQFNQEPLGIDFERVLRDHLWNLYSNGSASSEKEGS